VLGFGVTLHPCFVVEALGIEIDESRTPQALKVKVGIRQVEFERENRLYVEHVRKMPRVICQGISDEASAFLREKVQKKAWTCQDKNLRRVFVRKFCCSNTGEFLS